MGEGRLQPHGDWNIFRPQAQIPKPDLFDAAMKSKWNRGCSPERRLVFASMHHIDDEMIRLFDMMGGEIRFDRAVSIAKAFLRRGDETMAWKAVRASWAEWAPVDRAQTAPLVLLIDAGLAGLVTRDRAIELVHLPRATFLFEGTAPRRGE
ncbi:hypothetical protein [Bradyrhizobium elkanii]|uniref:hypothetical protein n=1 Tax=Bradyrhizobium elkanii TaxID=29448 RepID=UPI0004BBF2E3|nr:hypothetical protein [Bradyrhizobium elkanii]